MKRFLLVCLIVALAFFTPILIAGAGVLVWPRFQGVASQAYPPIILSPTVRPDYPSYPKTDDWQKKLDDLTESPTPRPNYGMNPLDPDWEKKLHEFTLPRPPTASPTPAIVGSPL